MSYDNICEHCGRNDPKRIVDKLREHERELENKLEECRVNLVEKDIKIKELKEKLAKKEKECFQLKECQRKAIAILSDVPLAEPSSTFPGPTPAEDKKEFLVLVDSSVTIPTARSIGIPQSNGVQNQVKEEKANPVDPLGTACLPSTSTIKRSSRLVARKMASNTDGDENQSKRRKTANSVEEKTAVAQLDVQVKVEQEAENNGLQREEETLNAADLLYSDNEDDEEEASVARKFLYTCPAKDCSSSYHKYQELEEHVKTHSDDVKDFSCDVCHKRFPTKDEAMAHIQERKEKKCCKCGLIFARPVYLVRHLRSHTGERPFACEICGKRFAQANCVSRHLLTHTGEKPFECKDCGKRFNRKSHLNGHVRIHSGQKPYCCQKCSARFAFQASLSFHLERNHLDEEEE